MVRLSNSQEAISADLRELERTIRERYPDLRLVIENGRPAFRGSFPIVHDSHELDRFLVNISFPEGIKRLPIIREIGGRIPRTTARHTFVGGGICTEVPELTLLREDYSLLSYLVGPVRNYFIGQSLVEQGKPWPFGEWDHGKEGLLQAYGEVLGVTGELVIRRYLDYLGHKKVKGHWLCPCGSGNQIRQCHLAIVRRLQEVVPPRIARQALERLNKYS